MAKNNQPQVPYSEEAEEALLGAVIVNPKVLPELEVRSDDFFLMRHTIIWQAIESLYREQQAIDYVTVSARLRESGTLDEIGGAPYLTKLVNAAPSSMHAHTYSAAVIGTAQLRRLLTAADEIKRMVFDKSLRYDEIAANSERALLDVINRVTQHRGRWFDTIMSETFDEIESAMQRADKPLGITTGLTDLDATIDGFQPGKLYVVAGRPGMGKSAFIAGAVVAAAKAGHRVMLFSNEMSESEVKYRMLAQQTRIQTQKLRRAKLMNSAELARYTAVIGELEPLPIFIDDTPDITPRVLKSAAHFLHAVAGVEAIFFDGMYRMDDDMKHESERQKYGAIAKHLKNLARLLNVPVITTHQLNRGVEHRADKRPILSDLRESGRIEEEADAAIFLYRDVLYNEESEQPNQADFIIAKQRDGKTGTITTHFEPSITKFSDAEVRRIYFDPPPAQANGRKPRHAAKHYSDDL